MTELDKAAGTGAGVHWFVAWRYLLARPRRLSGPILSVTALCLWLLAGFGIGVSWFPLADELISPFAVMPWWLLIAAGLAVALVVIWLLLIGARFVIYSAAGGPVQRQLRQGFLVLVLLSGLCAVALASGKLALGGAPMIGLLISWVAWLAAAALSGALSRHPGDAAPAMLVVPIIGGLAALALFGVFDYFHRPYGAAGPEPIGPATLGAIGAALLFLLISLPLVVVGLTHRFETGELTRDLGRHVEAVGDSLVAVKSPWVFVLGLVAFVSSRFYNALRNLFPGFQRYWIWVVLGLDLALVGLLLVGAVYSLYQVIWPARALVPGGSALGAAALGALVLAAVGFGAAVALRKRRIAATAIRAALLSLVLALGCAAVIGVLYVRGLAFSDLPSATRAGAVKLPLGVNIPMLVAGALLAPTILLAAIRYVFTFFSTVSIGGVAIGTMALVIVLSVMSGFESDLRRKILGSNAHILVTKASDEPMICKVLPELGWHRCVIDVEHAFTEYRAVGAAVEKTPGVVASSPYLISEVVIAANNNYANVIIKGVDPETVGDVGELDENTETPDALAKLWPLAEDGTVLGKPAGGDVVGPPLDLDGAAPDQAPAGLPDEPVPLDLSGGDDADAGVDFELPDDPVPLDLSGGADAGPDAAPLDADRMPPLDLDDDFAPSIAREGLHDAAREFTASIPPRVAILPGVLVGRELVKQINLYDGQEVKIVSPLGQDTPLGPVPRTKPFRVAGVFFTGMYEYDLKFIYVEVGALQDFLDLGDEVTGIEIRVAEPENTGDVVAALSERLGPAYEVQDWKGLNRSLFSALKLEKIAMFLVLAIIILVASFSIVGNLIMVVIEKAREIAVLKTLGASDTGVMKIFVTQGFFIGLVGTGVGVSLGLLACWAGIQFGLPLDPDVYYIDKLPIHVEATSVLLVAAAGIIISVVATLYPAWIAARLRPIHGLRYE